MVENYVSVSGITTRQQLEEIFEFYRKERMIFPLAIGYQVSSMSINQGTQNPRQPKFSELKELNKWTQAHDFITAIHYYTRDNNTIVEDMQKLVDSGIKTDSLIQFNSLPPSSEILQKVKSYGFQIIQKVAVANKNSANGGYKVWKGDAVEDVSSGNPQNLVNQIMERKDFIDYAMFDPSHGTNLELDLGEDSLAIRFGKKLLEYRSLDSIGLVFAGGIKPSNVREVVRALNKYFPNRFSIDTEGGVRTNNELDMSLVKEYLLGYRETRNS